MPFQFFPHPQYDNKNDTRDNQDRKCSRQENDQPLEHDGQGMQTARQRIRSPRQQRPLLFLLNIRDTFVGLIEPQLYS
ncbi:hypothetical protein D3C81_2125300 [compost metagenome]